ncbi:MAG: Sec-independent protein translocase protein TatB [Alphaproteobacteria bacterium]|jgi:sec-independent protein translocase protein TatB|uniref:Twin-arginine translocase subunit TatB n=1 Tax=PS1 clade bacterium TaxID=2175152 RepID=A0A368DS19_9PROT|nr:twin-arginine translocase subunit TatB [Rhodobiaceae bacterium]MBH20425.1 twin-arginine translocase subunit TatB [Rhodobiaceae bacterium]OUT74780.1 MAG: twin-arginine translocase subunit TatB [Rhizobiales bacterium TMED25]RCL74638.1 MAG: twin-arginine translocase subunit TatB [PS1 clade bacterium]|tara:strand:- start:218 stop:484 length:267 start_codon:yes stop_codon:yes gene_type:complete
MFNIGWQEFLIISVVIVIILGPKELPNALNFVLNISRKIQILAREFLSETENIMTKEDIRKVKQTIKDIKFDDNLIKEFNENEEVKDE